MGQEIFTESKQSEETIQEKLDVFKNLTINHPNLKAAYAKLQNAIREPGGSRMIFAIGPSGVGKTTLFKRLSDYLIKHYSNANDLGQIPVISVEVPAPSSGQFNWRHFYIECLKQLKDPITLHNCSRQDLFGNIVPAKERRTEMDLRVAFEAALKHRKTKIVMIDEAHHIAIVPSGRRMKDQTEFLKSTGNLTNITYVLFGTYDLLQLCNLNGQLANRSTFVHFPRYNARMVDEREIFQNVLLSFQNSIPTEEKNDLENEWEFLYERSIGCVGVLKLWLNRAVAKALDEGARTVTLNHLQETAHSVTQCLQQGRDALHGEKRFHETKEQIQDLRNLLGLNEEGESKKPGQKKKIKIKFVKPGQRKPTRDKIGQPA